MSNAISKFLRYSSPLIAALRKAYAQAENRKESALRKVILYKAFSGPKHEVMFRDQENTLKSAIQMTFPKPSKPIFLFTDALDKFWAEFETHLHSPQSDTKNIDQNHEPLAF